MVRLLLAVLAAACLWPMSTSATSAADRPNIVWLTTEDNSANWYRLYDENGATLPHITLWLDVKNMPAAAYVALSRVEFDANWRFVGDPGVHHFTPARF